MSLISDRIKFGLNKKVSDRILAAETSNEIVTIMEENSQIDKCQVLCYLANSGKIDIFEKLLYACFTPQEVGRSYLLRTNRPLVGTPLCDVYLKFAESAIPSFTSADLLIDTKITPLLKPDEIDFKMRYLLKHKSKLFFDVIKFLNWSTYKFVSFLCDNVNEELLADKDFAEYFNSILDQNIEMLINYNAKITNRYIFNYINRQSKKAWKFERRAEFVMYHATKENKWEILEYFAANKESIFQEIVTRYVKKTNRIYNTKSVVERYSEQEILDHYKDVDLSTLPIVLKDYIENLKVEIANRELKNIELKKQREEDRKKRRFEELITWFDHEKLVQLFTINSNKISSFDDYEFILDKFLESELSMMAFCEKYKIAPIDGFREMLEKFSAEDMSLKEQIEDRMKRSQDKFMAVTRRDIQNVASGEAGVEILISRSKRTPLTKIIDLAKRHFTDNQICENLAIAIIDYYHERLNSYDDNKEPENIQKMLTNSEIAFLTGSEEYYKIVMGKKVELISLFYGAIGFANRTNSQLFREKVNGNDPATIRNKLRAYNLRFNKSKYLNNTVTITSEAGEAVVVTPEIVETALQFAKRHGLYCCATTVDYVIRAVINGKIQQEDIESEKNSMKESALDLINENISLEEYFNTIDKAQDKF